MKCTKFVSFIKPILSKVVPRCQHRRNYSPHKNGTDTCHQYPIPSGRRLYIFLDIVKNLCHSKSNQNNNKGHGGENKSVIFVAEQGEQHMRRNNGSCNESENKIFPYCQQGANRDRYCGAAPCKQPKREVIVPWRSAEFHLFPLYSILFPLYSMHPNIGCDRLK